MLKPVLMQMQTLALTLILIPVPAEPTLKRMKQPLLEFVRLLLGGPPPVPAAGSGCTRRGPGKLLSCRAAEPAWQPVCLATCLPGCWAAWLPVCLAALQPS